MFNIKLLYLSNTCPEEIFHQIFTGENKPSQAAQKYHTLQIAGLSENGAEVKALFIPAISRKTYAGWRFKKTTCGGAYDIAPVFNVPILRNILLFFYVLFYVLREGRKAQAVICDVLHTTASAATLLAGKLSSLQTVGIVTDVPTIRAFQVKNPIERLVSSLSYSLLRAYDKYIFLTPDMNSLINTKNRPYLISEGHVDHRVASVPNTREGKYAKKVCLYAGSLRKIYGIEYMVQAFLEANVEDAELHVYGAGEYAQCLKELSQKHENIRFFGVQPNSHIVTEETKATLLINPRPTDEEYTRYSFPSKNMEYMASGTPVLTTKLPGMPKEYYPHVYLIEEENASALAVRLRELLQQPVDSHHAVGMAARDFVLKNKSNLQQGKRIIELIEL